MSGTLVIERQLADRVAERFPSAADVDRIAGSVGLPLAEIARHARPVDHWSSAIAVAIERGALDQLLDALRRDMPELHAERYAPLAAPAAANRRPSIELFLEWIGLAADAPWRLESGGKRCPLKATVRVYGGSPGATPILEWRHRDLLGAGAWTRGNLVATGNRSAGFSVWTDETDVVASALRTRRIDVRCRLDDQREREDRIVVSRLGYLLAIVLLVGMLGFVAVWLRLLPNLAVLLGLGGSAGVLGVGAIRGHFIDPGTRGPLGGLGPIERAVLVAVGGALAAVLLPPLLLVIVENQTANEARAATPGKETLSLAAHEGKTVLRWSTPLRLPQDQPLCVCPGAQPAPGCTCVAEEVRFVPVHHIQCRREAWPLGLPSTEVKLQGASLGRDGVVWRDADAACQPQAEASARFAAAALDPGVTGIVTARFPWTATWTRLALPADLVASTVTVAATAGALPGFRIDELTLTGAPMLPAVQPASGRAIIELFDAAGRSQGKLTCSRAGDLGVEPVEVITLDLPRGAEVTVQTGVTSVWTGSGPPLACVRTRGPAATIGAIEVVVPALVPGTSLAMPAVLRAARLTVRAGEHRLTPTSPPCEGRLAIIAVDGGVPGAVTGGNRTWQVPPPVSVGDQALALLCDPPATPTVVRAAGSNAVWELGPARLRVRPVLPTRPPVCRVREGRLDIVARVQRCQGPGCRTIADGSQDAATRRVVEAAERTKGFPCRSVCLCP